MLEKPARRNERFAVVVQRAICTRAANAYMPLTAATTANAQQPLYAAAAVLQRPYRLHLLWRSFRAALNTDSYEGLIETDNNAAPNTDPPWRAVHAP